MRKFVSLIALVALIGGYGCSKKDNTLSFDLGFYSDPQIVPDNTVSPYDPYFDSKVIIYYPPGFSLSDSATKYPVAYFLHGYGGDYTYFKDVYDLGTLMSYLIASDSIQPMILVFVNGRNMFYGSFYTNSEYGGNPVFGLHEDYLITELIPYVENQVLPKYKLSGERYIAGYSMGGYGTFMLAAKYPDKFQKAAALSGPHAFAIFADNDSARAGLFQFFKTELALDTLIFQVYTNVIVNDSVVATVFSQDTAVELSERLPIGLDTLFYLFSKPGDTVVDTMINQAFAGDTVYRTYYRVIHTFGYYPKSFTMYMTALSAAFTPKADLCTNFDPASEYIVAIVDSTAGICAGIRLPVYKNLDGNLVNDVITEWISDHDVWNLIQNNAANILASGIKWYMSSGTGTGSDLETVIYGMNQYAAAVFQAIYGDNLNDFVQINYYDGSTDPFGFPATHNQYIYEELGNVLRFFGK